MILAFLTGIVIGIAVAIPPGPVMFVLIRNSLQHGKRYALKISYGIALLDLIYSFTFSLATGSILTFINGFVIEHPKLVIAFQVICILGLIAYGARSLWKSFHAPAPDAPAPDAPAPDAPAPDAPAPDAAQLALENTREDTTNDERISALHRPKNATSEKPGIMERIGNQGPFFLGIALSLTHLINPTFVPLMTTVSYVAQEYGFMKAGVLSHHIAFAVGYAAGVLAWLFCLIQVSMRFRNIFSNGMMLIVNRVLGLTLIGVGVYWGYVRFAGVFALLRQMVQGSLAL
jgi:threonine/homoserine/homoserine lactone efflux protein